MVSNIDSDRFDDDVMADVESAELRASITNEGIGMTALKALNNDADTYVTLYHAFNGQSRDRIPLYMVSTDEGGSLLRRRFTADDIKAANADPKWLGKRVWYTKPQPVEGIDGKLHCPFSAHQPKDAIERMADEGFKCDCRKEVTFTTRDEVDRHVGKRHPRRYALLRETEERNYRELQDSRLAALLEALTADRTESAKTRKAA